MIIGLGLGVLNIPWIFKGAELFSNFFLKLLKLLSLPLVFFGIGSTITSIKNFNTMVSLGKKVLFYTLLTTIISASIGLILFLLIRPNMSVQNGIQISSQINSSGYLAILSKTVPTNILEPFIENNVISATFLATLLGISSLFLKDKEKILVENLFSTFFSLLLNIAKGVLKFLSLATLSFSILFYKEVSHNQENLFIFSKYLLCIVGANLLQGFVVLPWLLKANRLSPIKIAKAMSPALITAFFSKSSASTLPLTMEIAEEELKLSPSLSRFTFPLCSVINMNGCAAFILITVLFVSVSNGVQFSLLSMIGWVFLATLAAVGNAGVPMGCYFLTSSLLTSAGIPLHILGFILPFYTMLDMIETSLNVWSDCCVASLTNSSLSKQVAQGKL
ncbi:dicarboxylate symporter family protein [Chlamydia ibidis 10-1398/6]|uniref:Dicarboxylate symporter family protein n=2 Tax=Chlamydia ibidis TaxID=1405396 RepID=A0ABP2XEE7_9CHLA|nr:dicarboxylate symporter family protein [Chlamydia ibidis 10-1398/6]